MALWQILERARELWPEGEAVVQGRERRDYAELFARTERLARWMLAEGLAPGDRIAVLERNAPAYVELYFAAAGAGLVLCPLNTRLAPPELAEILARAEPRLLFHGSAFTDLAHASLAARPRASASASAPRLVPLPPLAHESANEASAPAASPPEEDAQEDGSTEYADWTTNSPPATARLPHVAPDALAQLYFTSGTTGRPKGVMLTHRNVSAHALAAIAELGFTDGDRWAHIAPLFHLADAWATFAITWVGGAHLFLADFDAPAALELLRGERATATNLVPVMLQRMLAVAEPRDLDESALRVLLSGGAPIAPAAVRRIRRAFGCEYVQTYGMTETSPFLTLSRLDARHAGLDEDARDALRAKTGRPYLGVRLEVVDDEGARVPRDERTVGEIRVQGETISPGYWNAPDETAAVFRDGWLYTGDLAVVDAGGFVTIVDRKKDMILCGGENVYSTEVENALYEHPGVLEAAVFGRPDPEWGERVCAAVVPRAGEALDAAALLAHCRERLAGYKCPKTIEVRPELPKTGSGKIQKARLRDGC